MHDRDGLYDRRGIWHFAYRGPDGIRRSHSTGTRNFPLARSIRARWVKVQIALDPAKILFSEAADRWLKYVEHCWKPSSIRTTRSYTKVLRKTFGDLCLKDIVPARISSYRDGRLGQRANRGINGELLTLRSILKHVLAWTPAHAAAFKLLPLAMIVQRKGLDRDELARLLATASSQGRWAHLANIIVLAVHSGMRAGEIRRTHLADINLQGPGRPTLFVRRDSTKTDAGQRCIPLDAEAAGAVRELLRVARRYGSREPEHFLLPLDFGRHCCNPEKPAQGWHVAWTTLRRAAGLSQIHFHDLRHTYAAGAMLAGLTLAELGALMGHMSAGETKAYIQIRNDAASESVDRVERWWREQKTLTDLELKPSATETQVLPEAVPIGDGEGFEGRE
jgi:integrase